MNITIKFWLSIIVGLAFASLTEKLNGPQAPFEGWWPIIVGPVFSWTIINAIHAKQDTKRIIRGVHLKRTLLRALVWIVWSLFIFRPWETDMWLPATYYTCFQWGVFAVQFDAFYNHYDDRTALSLGKTAWHDRLFQKLGVQTLMMIDTGLLVTSVFLLTQELNKL